jgi:hypothetical protein
MQKLDRFKEKRVFISIGGMDKVLARSEFPIQIEDLFNVQISGYKKSNSMESFVDINVSWVIPDYVDLEKGCQVGIASGLINGISVLVKTFKGWTEFKNACKVDDLPISIPMTAFVRCDSVVNNEILAMEELKECPRIHTNTSIV